MSDFMAENEGSDNSSSDTNSPFIDVLRQRIDVVKEADAQFKEYQKENKKRKRRAVNVDSDLSDFL
jgi:hypothetical protein